MTSPKHWRKQLEKQTQLQYRLLTSGQRQSPTFIVIGVVKGGTTSFYENLVLHPQVKPALLKETHYFDRLFRTTPAGIGRSFRSRKHGSALITGEGTPNYMIYPFVAQCIAESCSGGRQSAGWQT